MSGIHQKIEQYFLRYDDLDVSIDISRMRFSDDFCEKIPALVAVATPPAGRVCPSSKEADTTR